MPFSSADKREVLVRPIALAVAILAVLAVMALLLPRNSLVSSLENIGAPDALSVAYLQTLLRAEPDNDAIRLLLVDHLAATGKIEEARQQLQAVKPGTVIPPEKMAYLTVKIAIARLLRHPDDQAFRRDAETAIKALMKLPSHQFSLANWKALADSFLQAGLPQWAAECYLRLADLDQTHQVQWLRQAAQWLVASGQNNRAASVQMRIFSLTQDVTDAKKAFAQMLAANRVDHVIKEIANVIGRFPDDRELLQTGLQAAMMMHAYRTARHWLEIWLGKHDRDREMMEQLVQLELAAGRPDKAYAWAGRLVELEPDNIHYHEQLAQVAEWSGHLQEAFAQWQWLIDHRDEHDDIHKARALANALHDYPAADRLLALEASKYALTQPESSRLAKVKEELGEPLLSEKARVDYLKESPRDQAAWIELAMLREYLGKLEESAKTWKEIERRFGRNEQTVIHRARLQALSGEPEQGLDMMRDYSAGHQPESDRFWKTYGDIAWDLEYHDDAMSAYRWLWDHELEASYEAQRLMILLREEGDYEAILKISKESWERFHDPDILLLAIESALQIGHWQDVKRLIRVAEGQLEYFWDSPRYWLAHARWELYSNRIDAAEHDYLVALKLSMKNEEARIGLIWAYIQSDQRRKLSRCLRLWQADAVEREPYWQAYAAGYRKLGRERAALPWLRKTLQAHPDDIPWMLEYADALAASGQATAAWRLRRHLFTKLWPGSRMHSEYLKKNGPAAARALIMLKQHIEGLPQAEAWMGQLLAREDDPVLREFAMRWYFGIERNSRSSYWLLRQHAKRVQAPLWMALAQAMKRNDTNEIAQLIAHRSDTDHISKLLAYRQLNELDNAWILAMDNGLGAGYFTADERTVMLRSARDIAAQSPNALHAGLAFDHIGALNLTTLGLKGFYSRHNLTTSLKLYRTGLRYTPALAMPGKDITEYEARLAAGMDLRRIDWLAYIGANQRSGQVSAGDRMFQWGAALRFSPWQGGETGLSLSVHDTGLETSAFRLVGARDQLRFHMASDITNREYLMVGLNMNRYQTRLREALARGESLDAKFGHRLQLSNSQAEEQIDLYLSGELMRNRLQPALSGYAQTLLPGSSVASVIPDSYSALGFGFNIQRDIPGNDAAISRTPSYLFDGWMGWQWPGNRLAYNLRAGFGAPLLGQDMLSLNAYLANSISGSSNRDSFYGVALWYSYRLGR